MYIPFYFTVKEMFQVIIELLPTNCCFAVQEWAQMITEIRYVFLNLSEKYDYYCTVYDHLLPYIFEKCDYNVSTLFDVVMKAIRNPDKQKKLTTFRTSKYRYIHKYEYQYVYCCLIANVIEPVEKEHGFIHISFM